MAFSRPSRRTFISAGAAPSVALPTFLSRLSRAQDKAAPSERLVMGCSGTGGKGRNNMETFLSFGDVQVKSVCDVDANHARMAKEKVDSVYGNQDCKVYTNFLELLADPEIDVVSIATPDHWHAVTSVAALNAGKDVYCEKPLANSVGEGRAIASCSAAATSGPRPACASPASWSAAVASAISTRSRSTCLTSRPITRIA